ncbi:hypothetical protein [Veronia nyctiphanis]|nr:hypothetical protein [Veronia nyctiphanis]
MKTNKNIYLRIFAYLPGCLVLALFVIVGMSEFWLIGVKADHATINSYKFGAEAMVSEGGNKYESATIYSLHCLITSLAALLGAVSSLFVLFKSQSTPLLKAYSITITALLVIASVEYFW